MHLDEADLREMGLREMGKQKRIAAAIINLRNWAMRASRQKYENEQLFIGRYSIIGTVVKKRSSSSR